jgi:predicted GNAT family acetyltransferase
MNNKYRWTSVKQNNFEKIEGFVKEHENVCTAPAAKFKKGLQKSDKLWNLCDENGTVKALLLYSGRALFPIFDNIDSVPTPCFMSFLFLQHPVYAIQGSARDVHQLETMLQKRGQIPSDPKDFYLMKLDALPSIPQKIDSRLIIRRPDMRDVEDLYELHKQYEIEEVIPKNGTFSPINCRHMVTSMIMNNKVLVGELDGRLVAKVNINADSYTRYQIGGVFVDPAFRSKGYASHIVALFCQMLISEGRGVTLFVNKTNTPAQKVYQKLGFQIISDYRITYY